MSVNKKFKKRGKFCYLNKKRELSFAIMSIEKGRCTGYNIDDKRERKVDSNVLLVKGKTV